MAGLTRPVHPHVAGGNAVHNHSYAHHDHHWWHHHYWNHGYWNGWYAGPSSVWDDGIAASPAVSPWYYESFFNVEPEMAVSPENGPSVSRGYLAQVTPPVSPIPGQASTNHEETSGPTESDGN